MGFQGFQRKIKPITGRRMSNRWFLAAIWIPVLAMALTACNFKQPLPMVTENLQFQKIPIGPGPEDFVLDSSQGAPRFLISCHERREPSKNGDIRFYQPDTGETGILSRMDEPERLKTFKPHGIDIVDLSGKTLLYVVLHDPYGNDERLENAVGVYQVEKNDLRMVALMEDKHLWSPNDLSVLNTGEIYLTNDVRGKLDLYLRRTASEIAHFDPRSGKWSIVADGLAFANGILAEADQVFVTTTLGDQVLAYPRNPDGTLGEGRTLVELKGGDNLTRYGQYLLTTAHYDDFAFLRHAKDAKKPSPSIVMRIDPAREQKKAIYVNPGKTISAASTALIYNGKLYISQVFDPFILVCDVPSDIDW